MLDIEKIRADFPALHQEVHGRPLIYFDNAATSQKPQVVMDALSEYYQEYNSNVHRGVHYLSQKATDAYEAARVAVQKHINAEHEHEVIYTRGTTESINLVAHSFGKAFVEEGDEIIVSALEHHSNIVPWQMLCEEKKAVLKVIPVNDRGELIMDEFHKLLSNRTKMLAVNHISNALGTINPVKEMIDAAHKVGAAVLIDGAQAVAHDVVDVQALDCDFYCFSSHKLFGPTGIGFLYGKEEWLNKMPPYQGGGEMIAEVSFEKTTYAGLPHKFEAGTPNIADSIAINAALKYMDNIGWDKVAAYEQELLDYGTEKLLEIEGLKIVGEAKEKASLISFVMEGIHPYDAGTILDKLGIAVRTGHHCAQPVMARFGIPGTIRASFAFYNTKAEIDTLVEGLKRVKMMLA